MISIFTQIVILIIVLACMVMVLLAIRQLTHYERFENSEETDHLKKDVENGQEVMSDSNIFRNLVDTDSKNFYKDNNYKSKSKEPLSRKE